MFYKKIKNYVKNINWKRHFTDTTAINAFAVPICAAMETSEKICNLLNKIPYVDVLPVSDLVSIKTRGSAIILGYFFGLASLLSKGRDYSQKLFKINKDSKEYLRWIHDAAYLVGFNAIVNPVLYYTIGGSRDMKEIIGGTLSLSVFSILGGAPIGYTIDIFRDLIGVKPCDRKYYPDLIKNQDSKTKKGLAALLTAGAVVATAAVYQFN